MRKVKVQLTEYISSMLPHSINFDGTSSYAAPDDIAGALGMAKLSQGAELMVRVKHLYEKRFTCDLWGEGFKQAMAVHEKDYWWESAVFIPEIVKAAMQEVVEERILCQYCSGRGWITCSDKTVECEVCHGKGYMRFDRSQVAQRAGIPAKLLRDYLLQVYSNSLKVFLAYELEIERGIGKHFLGDY
jgi:hypothetical protein